MDRITGLPDDLLLKILSFLPTKFAISTCILSKRWEFLWMWLPKLEYVSKYLSDTEKLRCFLNKNMPLHRAPIIESFRIHMGSVGAYPDPKDEDMIKQCVEVAVSRHLRELDIYYKPYSKSEDILPSTLYACKSLVILKIVGPIHLDVPLMACFPSLKTLQLQNVNDLDGESLRRLLSNSHVLENLSVKYFQPLSQISVNVPMWQKPYKPEDVKQWVEVALSPHLHELDFYFSNYSNNNYLSPSSLYACKKLVVLKLGGWIYFDVPRTACLPCLETLQLDDVNLDGESLRRLLSICPVLEKLSVKFRHCSVALNISINVPLLQYLSLCIELNEVEWLRIDTPSLKYFKLEEFNEYKHYISVENMPKLEEAYVAVWCHETKSLFQSITSVKRLTLCCPQAYSDRFVFKQLKHLKLCECSDCSADLFARLLKDAPNLQVLDFFRMEDHGRNNTVYWNEPSTVPECFRSSLQTFRWSRYLGQPRRKNVLVYILKNASRLKTATISFDKRLVQEKTQMMIKKLSSCSRASTTCQLIFYQGP